MGGKLAVTRNESQSMTLCIIFMLMCTTRQLFLTRGGKHKPSLYYVFMACHNRKTQTGSVFLCAYTHNEAVLIPVALEGELHINISKNSECPKKRKDRHSFGTLVHTVWRRWLVSWSESLQLCSGSVWKTTAGLWLDTFCFILLSF